MEPLSFAAIECQECENVLHPAVRVLERRDWVEWAERFCSNLEPNVYVAMPLVPFGTMVEFHGACDSVSFGKKLVLEREAFGGEPPSEVVFFAPYDLDVVLVDDYFTECCGPSAYGPGRGENVRCRGCGKLLGWIEETCFRHVNFTRIRRDQLKISATTREWPPHLPGVSFDPSVFSFASPGNGDESDRSVRLWQAIELVDDSEAETDWVRWSRTEQDKLRVERMDASASVAFPSVIETTVRVWRAHLQLAAARAMGVFG